MDNVLIDDRRIHVDFSQSVSHLWNRYRKLGKAGGDGQGELNHSLELLHFLMLLGRLGVAGCMTFSPTNSSKFRMVVGFISVEGLEG